MVLDRICLPKVHLVKLKAVFAEINFFSEAVKLCLFIRMGEAPLFDFWIRPILVRNFLLSVRFFHYLRFLALNNHNWIRDFFNRRNVDWILNELYFLLSFFCDASKYLFFVVEIQLYAHIFDPDGFVFRTLIVQGTFYKFCTLSFDFNNLHIWFRLIVLANDWQFLYILKVFLQTQYWLWRYFDCFMLFENRAEWWFYGVSYFFECWGATSFGRWINFFKIGHWVLT